MSLEGEIEDEDTGSIALTHRNTKSTPKTLTTTFKSNLINLTNLNNNTILIR